MRISINNILKINVTLFKRVCVIVDRRHAFIRFITAKDLSAVSVDTGTVR
jgi:hypothetical protein